CTYSNVSSDRADQGARGARSEGRARDYGAVKGGSRKGVQPSRLNSAVLQLDIVLFEFASGAIAGCDGGNPLRACARESSMQTHASPSSEGGPGSSVPALPSCPTCKAEMRFVQATSIAITPDLVEVSYICDECGRGTKRTLKESRKSS